MSQYIILQDDQIIAHECGPNPPEGARIVPDGWMGSVGDSIKWYDRNMNPIPLIDLIDQGICELSPTMKIVNRELVAKSEIELYKDGVKEIPYGQILDGDYVRDMTYNEKIKAGIITFGPALKSMILAALDITLFYLLEKSFPFKGNNFQASDAALQKLAIKLSLVNAGMAFDIEWRTFDDHSVTIKSTELAEFASYMMSFDQNTRAQVWSWKDRVTNAGSLDEILMVMKEAEIE